MNRRMTTCSNIICAVSLLCFMLHCRPDSAGAGETSQLANQDSLLATGKPRATLLGIGHSVVAINESQLAQAAEDPSVEVVFCPSSIKVTRPVDLGQKDIIAGPKAFHFSDGGRLLNGCSISRISPNARYPIFMNAQIGFWVWYTGRVTHNGKRYAPLPNQGTPPTVLGAWNNQERDITMWSQYHEGRYSDAIEAAQNSLPGKGDLAERFGTIRLPAGVLTLERPVYYTAGMRIVGNDGPSNAKTILTPCESFADPDRLRDITEDFVVVGIPQNRNNPSRVATSGGGGDGKSVFDCCLRNLHINTRGGLNGILLHASRGSEISNVSVLGGAKGYRAWVIRGSDDFKLFNTWADGEFDVCYDLIGSCLNVDIDGSRTNCGPESIGYRLSGDNRMGAIRINNANIEHTGIPFDIRNPRGVFITNFSAQGGLDASPVAIIRLPTSSKWPNHELILQGSVTKGFDRVHVIRGEEQRVWRIKTRQLDDSVFVYDWADTKWAGVDFNFTRDLVQRR